MSRDSEYQPILQLTIYVPFRPDDGSMVQPMQLLRVERGTALLLSTKPGRAVKRTPSLPAPDCHNFTKPRDSDQRTSSHAVGVPSTQLQEYCAE